jgi:hypothetical protein
MVGASQSGDMAAAGRRFFRLAKGVEIAATTVTKQQALDVQYFLARETPVDVGTARSNWRISVGRPLTGRISAYSPYASRNRPPYGRGGSKGETANLGGVVTQGVARLATYKKGSIYVSNALPYIKPLDDGHSPQSSSGWVARAIYSSIRKTEAKIKPIFDKELSK